MHWLKLYTEIVNDPKIQLLEPSDRWHYIVLLCAKADGLFEIKPALRLKMLEVQLRLSSEKMNCLYERLREVMLIDENWSPAGWDKRQVTKDPTGKLRKRAQRERNKKLANDLDKKELPKDKEDVDIDIDIESHVTVTGQKRDKCDIKDFNEAYSKWPRKVGKAAARKAYLKLDKDTHPLILADIDRRHKHNDWPEEERFIPHFATHLNREGWFDEPGPSARKAGENYV